MAFQSNFQRAVYGQGQYQANKFRGTNGTPTQTVPDWVTKEVYADIERLAHTGMTREDLNLTTVQSSPRRGNGGDARFPGNYSPIFLANMYLAVKHAIWKGRRDVEAYADICAGSGTGNDVMDALGCHSVGIDLAYTRVNGKKSPVGRDAANDEIEGSYDFISIHPAYGKLLDYSAVHGREADPRDMSHMDDPDFFKALEAMYYRAYNALSKGGVMMILMGDWVKNGEFHGYTSWQPSFGTIVREGVKLQHNCFSDKIKYSGRFISVVHERWLLIQREDGFQVYVRNTSAPVKEDIRNREDTTWFQLVHAAVIQRGGKATFGEIYDELKDSLKARGNRNVRAKIRQTVYRSQVLRSSGPVVTIDKRMAA